MFWADKVLEGRIGKEWINDAWTPSGIVHMGGLKGPVIHDTLSRVIKDQGREVKFTFGFDDMDAIDGLPPELKASHKKYMGIPIANAPSPNGKGTFGEYYGNKMRALFKILGINAEIYLASDYYKKGIYNEAVKFVLDNADKARKVYEEMYKKKLSSSWYPLQVVCPNCGKVGTTEVTGWDGETVSFICKKDKVKWAEGCEKEGKISPFDGNATMPFKVEWAAKWWAFGVTIEGAGKDHASAGGTYDVARKITKDVFGIEPPLALPYEFFLSGGKKMSSSKGVGLNGEDLVKVMPPEVVRFLMIKAEPIHAVEFSPFETDAIPNLYDEYQKAAEEGSRSFVLSQIDEIKNPPKIRFSVLAQWVQMPNMEGQIKKEGLEEWAKYAKVWIEKYAPVDEKFVIQKETPKEAKSLSKGQKELLLKISEELDKKLSAEDFQTRIYEMGKELGLKGSETFAAIYIAILGKNHGPKAAWLILSLDREFIKKRFSSL